jgi:hypothetical protein
LYSERRIRCAPTSFRSEPKVRREAVLLTCTGLSHAEDVAIHATRSGADNDRTTPELAVAEHPNLATVLPGVLDLHRQTCEHHRSILKVQTSFLERTCALVRIVGDARWLACIQRRPTARQDEFRVRIARLAGGSESKRRS